jgi:hypothetical protein
VTHLRPLLAAAGLGLVVAACGGGSSVAIAPAPASPEATVGQFFAAVNADDLRRMGMLFGDERGPILQVEHDARQRDMKLAIMQRVLSSDSVRVRGIQSAPDQRTRRVVQVEVFHGGRGRVVPVTVAMHGGGWLVQAVDIEVLMPGGAAQTNP